MGVRDKEIQRLVKYAEGMGVKVQFKPYVRGSGTRAEWDTEGTFIVIYTSNNQSKLDKILTLIHELGHHKGFVKNNRQIDLKAEEVLDKETPNKKERLKILNMEIEDAQYWEEIYTETGCTFNINKLHKQRELDLWVYEVYYETGFDPTVEQTRLKKKELKKKYKC